MLKEHILVETESNTMTKKTQNRTIVLRPAHDLLLGVRPQQIAQQPRTRKFYRIIKFHPTLISSKNQNVFQNYSNPASGTSVGRGKLRIYTTQNAKITNQPLTYSLTTNGRYINR